MNVLVRNDNLDIKTFNSVTKPRMLNMFYNNWLVYCYFLYQFDPTFKRNKELRVKYATEYFNDNSKQLINRTITVIIWNISL